MDLRKNDKSSVSNRSRRKRKCNESEKNLSDDRTTKELSRRKIIHAKWNNTAKVKERTGTKKLQHQLENAGNTTVSEKLREYDVQNPKILTESTEPSTSCILNRYQKEVLQKKLEKDKVNKSHPKRKNIAENRLKLLRKQLSHEIKSKTNPVDMKETEDNLDDKRPPKKRLRIAESKINQHMEVDNIIDEINQARFNDCQKLNDSLDTIVTQTSYCYQNISDDDLIVVVDTNIMLSHIFLLEEILNYKATKFNTIVVIPWRVFSELDNLKNNKRIMDKNVQLGQLAKNAIRYLHKNLPTNPRLIGQSLKDAYDHLFPCHIPDDEILNCCLQQTKSNENVILLSNDKNLCNKASVNEIKCFTHDTVKSYLLSCESSKSVKLESTNVKNNSNKNLFSKNESVNSRLTEISDILNRFFSVVLEEEMKFHFQELWEKIILHKPPWRIQDIFDCILKHWIAVFSETFPKGYLDIVKELKYYFPRRRSVNQITSDDVKSIISSSMKLVQPLQMNFKRAYSKMAKDCFLSLKKLLEKDSSDKSPIQTESNNEKTDFTMDFAESTTDQIFSLNYSGPSYSFVEIEIFDVFQFIWKGLSNFCSLLANSLEIDHSLEDKISVSDLEMLIRQADSVTNQINLIIENLSRTLMSNSVDESSPEYMKCEANKAIDSFYKILIDTLLGMNRNKPSFNNVDLFKFSTKHRNLLEDGFEKFTILKNIIQRCSEKCSNLSNRSF